jgi:hypothetical protein
MGEARWGGMFPDIPPSLLMLRAKLPITGKFDCYATLLIKDVVY